MENNTTMVVTGSSKGIGKGISEFFINRGYLVFGCSRSPSSIEHSNYNHTQVDIMEEKQVRDWFRKIKNSCIQIEVLVCNAGLAPANTLLSMMPGKLLDDLINTNIKGTYYTCREAANLMMAKRTGSIITMSSMSVGLHLEGTSAYSASKSAIVEMTKILAKELAPFEITCNVLAPSMIMTDTVEALGETVIAKALEKLTIKRKLTIEEICNVISFFAAAESRCITGQVIHMGLVN